MADPTAEFFDHLARRGFDDRLDTVTGTIDFDLDDGEKHSHWVVAIDRGHIAVSAEPRAANCVLHTTPARFNAIILGEDSALAAMFRGATTTEGNLQLLLYFAPPRLDQPGSTRAPRSCSGDGRGFQPPRPG
jgi:hypothetical protein